METEIHFVDMARSKDGDITVEVHEIDTERRLHRWFDVYLWAEDIPEDGDEFDLAVMAEEKVRDRVRYDPDWQTERQMLQERMGE